MKYGDTLLKTGKHYIFLCVCKTRRKKTKQNKTLKLVKVSQKCILWQILRNIHDVAQLNDFDIESNVIFQSRQGRRLLF